MTGGPWVCLCDCVGMARDWRSPGVRVSGLEMVVGL